MSEEKTETEEKKAQTPEEIEAQTNHIARAGYDLVLGVMQQLAMKADETASRNYAGFTLNGFAVGPFERVEVEFMRPGGMTPSELVKEMKEKVLRVKARLGHLRVKLGGWAPGRERDEVFEVLDSAIRILSTIPDPNP